MNSKGWPCFYRHRKKISQHSKRLAKNKKGKKGFWACFVEHGNWSVLHSTRNIQRFTFEPVFSVERWHPSVQRWMRQIRRSTLYQILKLLNLVVAPLNQWLSCINNFDRSYGCGFGVVDEDGVVSASTTSSTCLWSPLVDLQCWLTRRLGEIRMMWVIGSLDQRQDVVQRRPRAMWDVHFLQNK